MNVEILTLYESYFRNADNFKIFIGELPFHHCRFCSSEEIIIKVYYCKSDILKIVLEYLNHLKLISYPSWDKIRYFFKSIRISGFLVDDFVAKWTMLKWREKDIFILCSIK